MSFKIKCIIILALFCTLSKTEDPWIPRDVAPSVMVAILVRNKAHTLPFFLHYIENLDYPKDRIRLWIRSDHNVDNSAFLVRQWLAHIQHLYNHVDFVDNNSETSYSDAEGISEWSKKRVDNVLQLRQEALNTARVVWSDYVLFMDCDNFLLNDQLLKQLIKHNKPVIAAMLNTTAKYYSNFWGDIDENGYYRRSDNYYDIQKRHIMGAFQVPVVHSTFLIQTRDPSTTPIAFYPPPEDYQGPYDDIIIFASSLLNHHVPSFILNEDFYGVMLAPLDSSATLDHERQHMLLLQLEAVVADLELDRLPYMPAPEKPRDKMGFDEIYMINLERRPDRRDKMIKCFDLLNIDAVVVNAVDGRQLNETWIKQRGISVLPEYADPYHGTRTMTLGEIGCFMSHYNIWRDVLEKGHDKVLVFEDDIRFRVNFRNNVKSMMSDLMLYQPDWDLVYIGRKKLYEDGEPYIGESELLVSPLYSYWTLGYALSHAGALKLLKQQPLQKLVPVDEYLPIMFDKHPREDWYRHFEPRDLVTLSTDPLLIEPTHYTGEPGYFTDTEESVTVDALVSKKQRGDTATMEEFKSEL